MANGLAVFMSALALAAVTITYFKVDELSDRLNHADRADRTVAEATPERDTEESEAYARPEDPVPEARDRATAPETDRKADSSELESMRKELANLRKKVEKNEKNPFGRRIRMPRFFSNTKQLAKHLNLSQTQQDRVDEIASRTRQRIQDILKTPGPDGTSPFERRKKAREDLMKAIRDRAAGKGDGNLTLPIADLSGGLNQKIPGTDSTYRDEVNRVKKEGKDEIGGVLDTEQKKKLDDVNIDPMLGGHGMGGPMVSTSFGPGENGEVGAIAIAEPIEIVEEEVIEEPEEESDK